MESPTKVQTKVWIESSCLKLARLVVLIGLAWVKTPAMGSRGRDSSNPKFVGQEEGRVVSRQNCAGGEKMDQGGQNQSTAICSPASTSDFQGICHYFS